MRYQNPQILYFLFAIAIPIIIHLFNLHKHKLVYFSNIHLLKEIQSKTNSILDHSLDISNTQDNFEWALSQLGSENFNYSYDYERVYPSLFFLYDNGRKGSYKFEFGR